MLTVKKLDANKTDWSNMPLDEMSAGNMLDADFTLRIYDKLWEEVTKLGLKEYNETLLDYVITMFIKVELKGFYIDENELNVVGKQLKEKSDELYNNLVELHFNKEANMNSNADIADFMYMDDRGLCLYPPKRTKKGGLSTDSKSLEFLLNAINEKLAE